MCCLIYWLFELIPEVFGILVFACLLGGGWIVFDEPGEVFSVVDFVTEHLFATGGITYQLVSFCWFWYKLIFRKRYKLEIDSVGGNKRDKINKGKD